MKVSRFASAIAAVGISAALLVGASSAAGAQTGGGEARFMKGTWTGASKGYANGRWQKSEIKLVINETREFSAKGTKQWRLVSSQPRAQMPSQWREGKGAWSKPEAVYFTLLFEDGPGLWRISGVEGDGVYQGSTTQDGGLYLIYMEPGSDIAILRWTLKKS